MSLEETKTGHDDENHERDGKPCPSALAVARPDLTQYGFYLRINVEIVLLKIHSGLSIYIYSKVSLCSAGKHH